MTTMDEKYGDGSDCIVCEECGLCITHLDCKFDGCGKEVTSKRVEPDNHTEEEK